MDWTGLVKPGLDSFVKHGLDSFCKTWTGLICKTWTGLICKTWTGLICKTWTGLICKTWTGLICKTWTGLICKTWTLSKHFTEQNFASYDACIFQTRKDQNKSKFKEKIQHYQFDLTFYGICTFCFIFQLSI